MATQRMLVRFSLICMLAVGGSACSDDDEQLDGGSSDGSVADSAGGDQAVDLVVDGRTDDGPSPDGPAPDGRSDGPSPDATPDMGAQDSQTDSAPLSEICDGVDQNGNAMIDEGTFVHDRWRGASYEAKPFGLSDDKLLVYAESNGSTPEIIYGIDFDLRSLLMGSAMQVTHYLSLSSTNPATNPSFTFKAGSFTIPYASFQTMAYLPAGAWSSVFGTLANALLFFASDGNVYILEDTSGAPAARTLITSGRWSVVSSSVLFAGTGQTRPAVFDAVTFIGSSIQVFASSVDTIFLLVPGSAAQSVSFPLNSWLYGDFGSNPPVPVDAFFAFNAVLLTLDDANMYGGAIVSPSDAGTDGGLGDASFPDGPEPDGAVEGPFRWRLVAEKITNLFKCEQP